MCAQTLPPCTKGPIPRLAENLVCWISTFARLTGPYTVMCIFSYPRPVTGNYLHQSLCKLNIWSRADSLKIDLLRLAQQWPAALAQGFGYPKWFAWQDPSLPYPFVQLFPWTVRHCTCSIASSVVRRSYDVASRAQINNTHVIMSGRGWLPGSLYLGPGNARSTKEINQSRATANIYYGILWVQRINVNQTLYIEH